jgi:hypothetical protein
MASKKAQKSPRPARTTTAKKARAPRKPLLERAIRLGGLLAKQHGALAKNVLHWKGEATHEQRLAVAKVGGELRRIAASVEIIENSLVYLEQSKYSPKAPPRGLSIGAPVAIKEKRYDKAVHGATNVFTVVGETEKYLLVQVGKDGPKLGVPRGWLERREVKTPVSSKSAPPPVSDIEDVADEADEDPGLSPEG